MTDSVAVTLHAIRQRAYERWLERGSPDGSPERDWLEAERELLAEAPRAGSAPEPSTDAARAESRTRNIAVTAAPLGGGAPRRRAPRSIVTRAANAPARLLAALVPEAAPELGAGRRAASRGRR